MVVMDSTTLLLVFDPNANPPIDPTTGKPLHRGRDRVEHLIATLSARKTTIVNIPRQSRGL